MLKVGRYTAALVLIVVGGALLIDKLADTRLTPGLAEWWPVLFIMLGLEYIWCNKRQSQDGRPQRLDLGGIIFSVMIAAIVIVSVQVPGIWKGLEGFKGLGGTNIASIVEAFSDGKKFDKELTEIPVTADIAQVRLVNTNGNMTIKPGDVERMEISLTVYVNTENEDDAAKVAEASRLEHSVAGDTLEIRTVPREYGSQLLGKRRPRMDLVITVPAGFRAAWDVELTNGHIEASKLLSSSFAAKAVNGEISVKELSGTVELRATNGQVKAENTEGQLSLHLSNGSLEVSGHRGSAKLNAMNAETVIARHSGDIDMEMINGSIWVDGELGKVRTQSVSASVQIAASRISGDWDIGSEHGKINLTLPADGNYTVEGEGGFGSIQSNLPLTVAKKSITGSMGEGTYRVYAHTKGALQIQSAN
ncbi:DUF4097 and DUF4098 domain-containing protein YvlB [Paenibacillus sp. UNCCL117]|uniref:DUF4097 family beta strand repeat-containing protein n=1 Tax=unclassified Paenibacillus TaxID=185978 RepID=UPI000889484C|nr:MULTISPECIES: DUF4097 family beta strand repeat-containing protein [unclassified Paenibacillus]SDE39891.1 DUF4097 and DUF4098 domain-containing protein YvlB [Paenibacillus sp. cl123]SFW65266.1 DUF4097 and DUF4098 domain-containing protein YvlB [Paenibacillus sp. UNCCL117]